MMLVVSILKVIGLLQPRNITLLSSSCDNVPFDIMMLRSRRISLILGQSQKIDRNIKNAKSFYVGKFQK